MSDVVKALRKCRMQQSVVPNGFRSRQLIVGMKRLAAFVLIRHRTINGEFNEFSATIRYGNAVENEWLRS